MLKCQQHIVIINKISELNKICNWKRDNTYFQSWNIQYAITAANAAYAPFVKQNLVVSLLVIWEFNYNKKKLHKA